MILSQKGVEHRIIKKQVLFLKSSLRLQNAIHFCLWFNTIINLNIQLFILCIKTWSIKPFLEPDKSCEHTTAVAKFLNRSLKIQVCFLLPSISLHDLWWTGTGTSNFFNTEN